MKILITGATGIVGSELVSMLEKRDDIEIIYCVSRKKIEKVRSNKVKNITADITDYIDEINFCDVIINCAGEKNDENRMEKTNIDGAINLLTIANAGLTKKFIHLSSVGSYGADRYSGKVDENFICSPQNKYEETKLNAEKKLLQYNKRVDLNLIILQPSNIIEINKNKKQVLPHLVKLCEMGYAIKIAEKDGWLNFISLEIVLLCINKIISDEKIKGKIILNCPKKYSDLINLFSTNFQRKLNIIKIPIYIEMIVDKISRLLKAGSLTRIKKQLFGIDNNRFFQTSNDDYKFDINQINEMYLSIFNQKK